MTCRKNLKVDLGYRYRRIDGGPMFAFDPATIAAGASGTQGDDPGFTSHEVSVGLRYDTLVGAVFQASICSGGLRSAICVFGSCIAASVPVAT